MNKKWIGLIGTLLLVMVLAACGNIEKDSGKNQSQGTAPKAESAFYYTADEGGSITKVDAGSQTVVETIKLNGAVHNVQVSPDGKVLGAVLVPSMGGHDEKSDDHGGDQGMKMNGFALFYDTTTNKLIKQVEVGNHPAHIVFTNDGKYAVVTNNEDNNVTVIDAATYKVNKTIATGKSPHGFRISADSRSAYVANMGEDTVSVLDVASGKEIKKIKVGQTPVTTGITSNSKTMVVTLNAENALAVVDLTTDKVEKIEVGTGPAQVFIESDDRYAFVAIQGTEQKPSNTLSKIDLTTKKVVATIQTGKGAHGVVVSKDNKQVYVTNMFENTVSVIDNSTNQVVSTVKVGQTPNGISYR